MMVLDVIALTAAGLLVGNELSIAAFVHPALCRLPDAVHVGAATALARVLGRAMPFWYALVVVLTVCVATVEHHETGTWSRWVLAAAGLFVLCILYTVSLLVPINNRVAGWTEEARPADWKEDRARWDRFHRWRVLMLAGAFIFLVVGVLMRR